MGTDTKQQKKVPELRFGDFSDEWTDSLLSQIVKLTDCKHRTPDYVGEGVPVVSPGLLSWGPLKLSESKRKVTLLEYESLMDHCHPEIGDLVFGRNQSLGIASVICDESPFVLGQDTVLLQFKSNAKWFLFYLLQTEKLQNDIYKKSGGSTFGRINISDIKKLHLSIPKTTEQQIIADFLVSVDAWLDNLRQQKTALETYKRGMMQKLFTQQIRFKDENGKEFPKWQEKKLGDVFTAVKGAGISKDELVNDGVNECILYGELYTTYKEIVTEIKSRTNISTGTRSKVGDILIPCSTTTTAIDLANVTALNKDNVLLGGDITVLRGKAEIDNVFYAYYLSNHKKIELAKYGQGVTIIHIYYGHFKDMLIDVPSLVEQQKIADFLTAIDQTITAKAEEITKVEQWKKGLMQKMFV